MKYLITENKMNDLIEKYIKSNFSEVVSVRFYNVNVYLASDARTIVRTDIHVIADTNNVRNENIEYIHQGSIHQAREFKRELWNELNSIFNLGLELYGSKWGLEVFFLEAKRV